MKNTLKNTFKVIGKVIGKLVTILLIVVLFELLECAVWGWRHALNEVQSGRCYASDTYSSFAGVERHIRIEALDGNNKITGVKYDWSVNSELVFGVNMQNSWCNIIIGDKIINLHK